MRLRILIFLALLAGLLSGCGYNTFQSGDEAIKSAWSEVLNQYQRRADLVPNLVATVHGRTHRDPENLGDALRTVIRMARASVSARSTEELLGEDDHPTTGLLIEQRGLAPAHSTAPQVYVVIGGAAERQAAFADIQALRAAGIRVEYPFKDLAFGKQFKAASDSGAKGALIYGGDELAKGVVKLRDLADRSEREIPRDQAVATMRDLLRC